MGKLEIKKEIMFKKLPYWAKGGFLFVIITIPFQILTINCLGEWGLFGFKDTEFCSKLAPLLHPIRILMMLGAFISFYIFKIVSINPN